MFSLQPLAIAVVITMTTSSAIHAMPTEVIKENPAPVSTSSIVQAEQALLTESPSASTVTGKEMTAFAMPYIAKKKALEDLIKMRVKPRPSGRGMKARSDIENVAATDDLFHK